MNKRERENERPLRLPASLSRCAMIGLLAAVGCDAGLTALTYEPEPFSYVGSVELGSPSKEGSKVVVPLTFSGGTWADDPSSKLFRIRSTIEGTEIEITVITSAGIENEPVLVLPEGTKGEFKVFYRDPVTGGRNLTQYTGERHEIGILIIDDD